MLSTGRDSTTSSMLATVGASALLHCPLTSHPAARITWYHGHRAVGQSSGTGVSVRGNGSLSISPVLKSHNGDYRCVATNQYGTAEANTVLQVTGKPYTCTSLLAVRALAVLCVGPTWREPGVTLASYVHAHHAMLDCILLAAAAFYP